MYSENMLLKTLRPLSWLSRLAADSSLHREGPRLAARLATPSATSVRHFTPVVSKSPDRLSAGHGSAQPLGSGAWSLGSGHILRHYSLLVRTPSCPVGPLLGLAPSTLPHVRTYKVRAVLKRRCKGCYFEKRLGQWFVECNLKPRHKQMQKMSQKNVFKDDYSKGNIQLAAHWGWRKRRFYWQGDNTPRDLYKPLVDYANTRVNSPA